MRRELVLRDPPGPADVDGGMDHGLRIQLDRGGDSVVAAGVEDVLERDRGTKNDSVSIMR